MRFLLKRRETWGRKKERRGQEKGTKRDWAQIGLKSCVIMSPRDVDVGTVARRTALGAMAGGAAGIARGAVRSGSFPRSGIAGAINLGALVGVYSLTLETAKALRRKEDPGLPERVQTHIGIGGWTGVVFTVRHAHPMLSVQGLILGAVIGGLGFTCWRKAQEWHAATARDIRLHYADLEAAEPVSNSQDSFSS